MLWNGESLRTLVILGAGATRGASFVDQGASGPKPPLDTDFFRQLGAAAEGDAHCHCAGARFSRERLRSELPDPALSRMEDYFVQAEFVERLRTGAPVQPSQCEKFQGVLASYRAAIAAVIHSTTSTQDCEYHARLATNLQAGDVVVSFNYDLLMDRALQSVPDWDAKRGYGFTLEHSAPLRRDRPKGGDYTRLFVEPTSVLLLKLHGSLSWNRVSCGAGDRSSHYEFGALQPDTLPGPDTECCRHCGVQESPAIDTCRFNRCLIVPPVWDKPVTESRLFRHLWATARVALRRCEALAVIGYSLPLTDKLAQAWFAVDTNLTTSRPRIRHLIVADPSKNVFARYVGILAGSRKEPQLVHYCPSWADFCNQLG